VIDRSYLTVQRIFYLFDIASAIQLPGRGRMAYSGSSWNVFFEDLGDES
jgi:hypothetical protein